MTAKREPKHSTTTHRAIARVLTEQIDYLDELLASSADMSDEWSRGRADAYRGTRRSLEIERDHHLRLAEHQATFTRIDREIRKNRPSK